MDDDEMSQTTPSGARGVVKSVSVNQILPKGMLAPADREDGTPGGSCCQHAFADGYNSCREDSRPAVAALIARNAELEQAIARSPAKENNDG